MSKLKARQAQPLLSGVVFAMIKAMKPEKQLLVLMLGAPGAGKSYFARSLAKQFGMTRIVADEVRTRLFGSIEAGIPPERKRQAYEIVNQEMKDALRTGHSVIRDNQNNHRADRDMCRGVAEEVGAHTVIVWVQTPEEVAIQRCMERDATPDQLKLDKATAQQFHDRSMTAIERPTIEEDFVTISGTMDFAEQLAIFRQHVASRG